MEQQLVVHIGSCSHSVSLREHSDWRNAISFHSETVIHWDTGLVVIFYSVPRASRSSSLQLLAQNWSSAFQIALKVCWAQKFNHWNGKDSYSVFSQTSENLEAMREVFQSLVSNFGRNCFMEMVFFFAFTTLLSPSQWWYKNNYKYESKRLELCWRVCKCTVSQKFGHAIREYWRSVQSLQISIEKRILDISHHFKFGKEWIASYCDLSK